MHLTPRETERLLLHTAAELARRRLARGALLGASEAVAYVCDEICELAWDDVPLGEVVERAGRLLRADQLIDGVADAVPLIQVEALFPHGSVLVHVDRPFGPATPSGPGRVHPIAGDRDLAPGRHRQDAVVRNSGGSPIWVSSHLPLDQLNPALLVALGEPDSLPGDYRLDVPAGTAVLVEPGHDRTVPVVRLARGLAAAAVNEGTS